MAGITPDPRTRALILVCAIVMLAGAGLRFVRLDGKIFGNDEATTSVHVSGHTVSGFAKETFDGKVRSASELLAYQRPDRAHGPRDVVASLAIEDPQHPPLYYLIERQWELEVGSSVAARRALSAVYGVFTIAAAIWLGVELMSGVAGAIMGALVAASPFAIAYAQVAREYSLWLALTFAATAVVVRAVRTHRAGWWAAYAIVAIAGLYTDTLFTLVVVAHAIALAFAATERRRASFAGFGTALLAILIAYAPWLAVLRAGYGRGLVTNNTYLAGGLPLKLFALKWIFNIGTLFYDADYVAPKTVVFALPGFVALAVCAVACVRLARRRAPLAFVASLALVAVLALLVPDLLHHQQRSTASRYLVPLWVAAYAALGVGLAYAFEARARALRYAPIAFVAFAALAGFASFAVSIRHASWWVDGSAAVVGSLATAIERTRDPLVLYHATWGPGAGADGAWDFDAMMLADRVPPQTRFAITRADREMAITRSAGTTLVLDPSDAFVAMLRARGDRPAEIATGSVASANAQLKALQAEAQKGRDATAADAPLGVTLWRIDPK